MHAHMPTHTFPNLIVLTKRFVPVSHGLENPNKPLGQPMFLEPSPLTPTPGDTQSLRKAGLGLVISH